jgi:hypothetical protein
MMDSVQKVNTSNYTVYYTLTVTENCHQTELDCWNKTGHWQELFVALNLQRIFRKKMFVEVKRKDSVDNMSMRRVWDCFREGVANSSSISLLKIHALNYSM